jgi:hypothetical protein
VPVSCGWSELPFGDEFVYHAPFWQWNEVRDRPPAICYFKGLAGLHATQPDAGILA